MQKPYSEKLPGTAFLAFPGMSEMLLDELKERFAFLENPAAGFSRRKSFSFGIALLGKMRNEKSRDCAFRFNRQLCYDIALDTKKLGALHFYAFQTGKTYSRKAALYKS